jgi:predicted house-cleaning NTP pyrophosphatase (Maf/HAM1 superfamily)
MTSKTEQERRKTIVREIAKQKKAAAIAVMPICQNDLSDLFDYLDTALVVGCDHTLRLTSQFLQARELPEPAILAWLNEYGGYCDCEVLANVEQELEQ